MGKISPDQVWTIEEVAKYLNKFPQTNDDRFVGIAGREGVGKSIFSLLEARALCKLKEREFKLEDILQYHRKKLIKSMEDNFEGVYIDDEAVREFGRTFYKKEQIEYVKMTKVIRFHRHIVFKNIPILWELDTSLRKRIAIYIWVKIKPLNGKPGLAYLFQREEGAFVTDPWNVKDNQKLERAGRIWSSPNYYGMIKIPNYFNEQWFKELEAEYIKIKEADKGGAYGEGSGDYLDVKTLSEVLVRLKNAKGLNYGAMRDIAKEFGVSHGHLSNEVSDFRRINSKMVGGKNGNS